MIEIALAPIALYHFQRTGVYGALANMLAIPLTTFIIIPSGGAALLLDSIGLGAPFWWICEQSIEIILKLAHYVSALPGAIKTTANIGVMVFALIIFSGLWVMILKTKRHIYGVFPLIIGFTLLFFIAKPDILVTSDGQHLAVINNQSGKAQMMLLRTRAGDYIRELLNENAGFDGPASDFENWPHANCSPDICIIRIKSDDNEVLDILATRSNFFVPIMELAAACKRVDIAISERYLPYSCKPKRLKIDRDFLQRSGGVAIYQKTGRIRNVAAEQKHLPWSRYNENIITTYPN